MSINETMTALANAVRSKAGGSSKLTIPQMTAAVQGIAGERPRCVNERSVDAAQSNYDGAAEAVKCAMGYWAAKNSGTRVFQYQDGQGPLKGQDSAKVNDASGRAIIDCSTYVGLVMRGVQYSASPYTNGAANATVDPKTIRCTADTWPEAWFDRQADASASVLGYTIDGKYRTLTASDMLAYYDTLGLAWKAGEREPRAGDLCFMAKANPDGTLHSPGRWRGVTHVGIMTDPTAYLNATDYDSSGDLIRTQVSTRAPQWYARPLYGGLTKGATDTLTNDLVQLMPVVWAGVKQGSSTVNGVSLSLSGRKLVCSGDGSSGFSRDVVSSACPLYLPPGTYRLSGVVNNTGGNKTTLNQYWGLRVYNADDGAGIPGTTWSANGANSQQRTPVWDIGGGGQFTLSAWTRVKIDMYLTGSRAVTGISADPSLFKIG